ncbi:hypothetical protein SAMN04489860_0069 [Paraoerskovia marina]|uniref:Uncharacterized protein n=1 Tax=Paraoerskovia marina TaxID=545619 RepID=A0A1H1LXJ9_9CELL|nr:hypothetical protein [Paraoerskovia marina]SDR79324.1 hypothetical protein SAMN04489860_0069 [Paraoerskovia marina]
MLGSDADSTRLVRTGTGAGAAVGPALGGAIGVVSATYPAVRAGRISAAIAVRAD